MAEREPSIVPRIGTDRLLLREARVADFEGHVAHVANPNATKYTTTVVTSREAWRMLCGMCGSWILNGAGWWMIELRETGEVVGSVGAFFRETTFHLGNEAPIELGWNVYEAFWRRGYAREAAKAALAFAFDRHPTPRAIAHVSPGNVASVGVTRALGMTHEGAVDFYGERCDRFGLARPT